MICLYAADESLFEHNGLGILDNDLKKCQVEEELNNLYTLTAQYPLGAKFGKSIRNGMIIKAPTPNGDQLFRIYQSKPSMGMLEIHAFHIFYDLAFNFVEDTNIVSKSGQAWLQQLSQNTQYSHPFTFFSDISTVAGSRVVRKNCVEILLNTSLDNSFVNRFGGEILRDNFNVYFNRSIGENRGFKIRHKKNLKGYTANIDDKSVITRIMPIGFDGLLLPEKYVDSPRISDYPFPRIGKVEVDVKAAVGENTDAKDAIPLNEAFTKMRALIKEQFGVIDVPTCSYEVDFVELSKTKEYADFQNLETVRIGDTVTVSHDEDGFYVEAKVIRYEYDSLAGRLLRIEAGQFESRSSNNSINQQRSIEQQLEDVKIETSNMVQVAANGKNTIYRGVDRPTNANVGDLWYEPLENSVVLKQWSGVDWELIPISDQNLGNVNVNNLSGNYIDVRRFRISSGDRDILYVNEAGEVILNAKRIQVDFTDVATKTDLQEIELTPGPQGAPGVGISSTSITYARSTSGTTAPTSGWTSAVPTVPAGEFLWTKTIWTYSDNTTETGYSVAKMGDTGAKGEKGDPGQDGLPGAPGVGIKSTVSTYGLSSTETTQPATWSTTVPALIKGQYLWTKNVWTYTDGRTETGYTKTYIPRDGNDGTNGIAGKDGVGIKSTSITYASSPSGTSTPTSGWSTSVPNVSPGMFLWTRTVWTYTDNTSETGYSVAKMGDTGPKGEKGDPGKDGLPGAPGVGIKSTVSTYGLSSNETTQPSAWSATVPPLTKGQFLWTKNVWTYTDGRTETGYTKTYIPKDGNNGTNGIAGKDGVGISSTTITYASSSSGTTAPTSGWTTSVPNVAPGQYLWTKTVWTYTDNTNETGYSVAKMGDTGPKGIDGRDGNKVYTSIYELSANQTGIYLSYLTPTANATNLPPLGSIVVAPSGKMYPIVAVNPTSNPPSYTAGELAGNIRGADGRTPYVHFAYADNADGTGLTSTDTGQRYMGHYSDYTQADSTDKTKYRWADRWAKIEVNGRNLAQKTSSEWSNPYTSFSGTANTCPPLYKVLIDDLKVGDTLKSRIVLKYTDIVPASGKTSTIWLQGDGNITGWNAGGYNGSPARPISGSGEMVFEYEFKITENHLKNDYWNWMFRTDYIASGSLQWRLAKVEKGTVFTGWSPAPEDVENKLDTKADQSLTQQQLNMLIEKAQLMKTELEAKVAMETLSDLERAYNAYVEANDKAVAKSQADLIEAGRRVDAMVETLGGLSKTKTFIDTYIKEANEGIIIGTKDNVSQIRITYDRIAMYSAGKEVMYISQGVIHIDNGVFTKSLQIGRFRTEQHQTNLDINVCRYVG